MDNMTLYFYFFSDEGVETRGVTVGVWNNTANSDVVLWENASGLEPIEKVWIFFNISHYRFKTYMNGTCVTDSDLRPHNLSSVFSDEKAYFYMHLGYQSAAHADYDNLTITMVNQFLPPIITNINCTSCNIPYGDVIPPYTTSDTTPTFRFSTDIESNCRISDENQNYTSMGSSRDCATGDRTMGHICTLTSQDELFYSNSNVYISCENIDNYNQTWDASVSLQMEITNLVANRTLALDNGIHKSSIWPGATIYSDQQVYLHDLNNNQVLATVDRVAVYGNQRWLFDYLEDGESAHGLFNITPVIYSLEMTDKSFSEIEDRVSSLINSTKN
jgi:hypothetical protein